MSRPRDHSQTLKPLDSAWTVVLIDPIGMRLLPRLVDAAAIAPIHLTVAAQLVGVGAAAAFALDQLVLGALLFELRFFIDCLDGKLARARRQTSRVGALLDAKSDRVVVLACFVAVAAAIERPWLAAAISAVYLLYFAMRDERDAQYSSLGRQKPVELVAAAGIGGWLRRRRIYPTLTTIEVEHVALFVIPLVAAVGVDLIAAALSGAAIYFGAQSVRFAVAALRAAAASDALAAARPERRDA